MFKYLISLKLLVLLLPVCIAAQDNLPIAVERDKVLSQWGESETVQMSLPIRKGIGIVSTQEVKRRGASALRLHFTIEAATETPSWAVQIHNKKNKESWSYSATSSSSTEFWSDIVPGDIAIVEVIGVADLTNLKLTIDRVIESRNPTIDRSIIVNKLETILGTSNTIQNWGRAVARLVFVADRNGRQYLCTGFLVSADLLMTNNHCIQSDSEMRSALVQFDYDRPGATPVTLGFKEMLKTDAPLDFTLLRLSTDSGRQPFTFDTSDPGIKPLLIIQHPAGRPKEVSIQNCKVMAATVAGVTPQLTDFGHGCDTLNGSSGAPVMDFGTGRVLGLHHLGFHPGAQPVNRAVKIQQILDFLTQNLSDPSARQALGLPAQ